MSEMVANKGIIKEIYAYEETLRDKLQALADELDIKLEELVNLSGLEDNEAWFNSHYWSNYTVINNRLFDTTDCPDLYDYESDHEDTVTKVGDHEYKLDFYYYNGGTNMEELFAEKVEKADAEYGASPEDELDNILSKHGVLTADGWQFVTEELRKDLLEWRKK